MAKPLSRDAFIEEVEHFSGFGMDGERLARYLGVSTAAAKRRLERAGRRDLAHTFDQHPLAA